MQGSWTFTVANCRKNERNASVSQSPNTLVSVSFSTKTLICHLTRTGVRMKKERAYKESTKRTVRQRIQESVQALGIAASSVWYQGWCPPTARGQVAKGILSPDWARLALSSPINRQPYPIVKVHVLFILTH